MHKIHDILKKYGKDLGYIEIKTLCLSKDRVQTHLATVVHFVEAISEKVCEERNGLFYFSDCVEKTGESIKTIFSDLSENFIMNNERHIQLAIKFDPALVSFQFYQVKNNHQSGHFQYELYGNSQVVNGNELQRSIYSFGSENFYSLTKEKLGVEFHNPDGSVFFLIPVNLSANVNIKTKTQCIMNVNSNLLDEKFSYSIKFFNLPSQFAGDVSKEMTLRGEFKQTQKNTECIIPIELDFLLHYEKMRLSIFDTDLGINLFSDMFDTKKLLANSSVFTSVIQEAYSIFRNPEDFKNAILNSPLEKQKNKVQDRFELEISRLLNCGGIQAIWLEKNDVAKDGQVNTIAADILAYDDRTCELYVISCKTGIPSSDETVNKVVDAKNKVEAILKRPEVKIRACIITQQKTEETPFMRSQEVILINKSKLEQLIDNKSKFSLS